jgi:excisionase family DNA binding protein
MNKEIKEQLDRMEKMLTTQQSKPFTFIQAAEYLNLSKSYLYKLTAGGKIRFYKPFGKRVCFRKEDLDEWVFQKPIKSDKMIEKEAIEHISK